MYTVWKNVGRDLCPKIIRYTQLDLKEVAERYYTKGGVTLKGPLPEITFEVEFLEGLQERDSLWAGLPYLVFSPKLREALRSFGVDNIEYYPATIKHFQTGETVTDYKIANIVGLVACFDWEQSRYEQNPKRADRLQRIDRLVIDEARIPTGLLLFRLQEMRTVILCHEDVAQKLIGIGVTGVDFVSKGDFSAGW